MSYGSFELKDLFDAVVSTLQQAQSSDDPETLEWFEDTMAQWNRYTLTESLY